MVALLYLQTDSSGQNLGAVLFQIGDGFLSRTLKGPQINYTATELEVLAILWALQRLRSLVLGRDVIIRTDHKAPIFLKRCPLVNN